MKLPYNGYYRYPTIQGEQIAFVAEDDLWLVPVEGGIARRLTANLAEVVRGLPTSGLSAKTSGAAGVRASRLA